MPTGHDSPIGKFVSPNYPNLSSPSIKILQIPSPNQLGSMKRSNSLQSTPTESDTHNKKAKPGSGSESESELEETEMDGGNLWKLDENLLYEVLKHADARTLAVASCVSKSWHRTALDERLWELIYTRQCANINCGSSQLRSVVLALGGFRRLHALYFSKPTTTTNSVITPQPKQRKASISNKPWGKDEVVVFGVWLPHQVGVARHCNNNHRLPSGIPHGVRVGCAQTLLYTVRERPFSRYSNLQGMVLSSIEFWLLALSVC